MITKYVIVEIGFSIGEFQFHGSGLLKWVLNKGNFVSH